MTMPILQIDGLTKCFKDKAHWFKKGKDVTIGPVSFDIAKGETLAMVGEAGSGKSTLARVLSGAERCDAGDLYFDGKKVDWRDDSFFCKHIRIIFQDAQKSLNPAVKIGDQLEQPLLFNTKLNAVQRQEKILEALRMVGLLPDRKSVV